jgi:hypothetical protein
LADETPVNLYIDIDGVLLGKADPTSSHLALANHAHRFLTFALNRFDCYWLTTHCKGSSEPLLDHLRPFVPDEMLPLLRRIKPTTFDVMKTEALQGDFFWIGDSPMASELEWLRRRGRLDRWIAVDTRKRPDDLLVAMERLKSAVLPPAAD